MDPFADRMEQLRTRFRQRATGDGEALKVAIAAKDRDTAIHILHSLAGNAGMFGYPALSTIASELEQAIASGAPEVDVLAKLQQLAGELPGQDAAAQKEPG